MAIYIGKGWLALLAYNLLVFAVFALDKARARRGGRRVPEARLLLLAALFGAPGALTAIWYLPHKSRKPLFAVSVVALLAAQVALLLWARRIDWWGGA